MSEFTNWPSAQLRQEKQELEGELQELKDRIQDALDECVELRRVGTYEANIAVSRVEKILQGELRRVCMIPDCGCSGYAHA